MDKKILIIEDEAAIQKILSEPLTFAGYKVTAASDGLQGINTFHEQVFDLILLDIMLPKIDGYTVCEMIRQESQIPIILLTALDTEDDQIKGFDKLADDYITKPFSIKLVLKRVEALLRRTSSDMVSDCIRYKEISLSETERKVIVSGNEVALTHLEFEILLLFLKNKGRVFTRDDLLNLVGKEESTKKDFRNDITEGKRTLVVVYALQNLEGPQRDRLIEILSSKEKDPDVLAEAVELMESSGAIDHARSYAENLTSIAKNRLRDMVPPSDSRDLLESMADWFVSRLK